LNKLGLYKGIFKFYPSFIIMLKCYICKRVYLKGCLYVNMGHINILIVHCLPEHLSIFNIQIEQMTLNVQPAASHQTDDSPL